MGILDTLFGPAIDVNELHRIAEASANPEVLAGKLEEAAQAARFAASVTANAELAERLEDSADKLDAIAGKINAGLKIKAGFNDVAGIYYAWKSLDPNTIRNNPMKAAKSFGKLFKHAGGIAKYLPMPLSSYAEFLAGFEDFFANVVYKMDFTGPGTTMGRALRELEAQEN